MKKRIIKSIAAAALALASVFCFAACGKEVPEITCQPVSGRIDSISKYGNIILTTSKAEMRDKGYMFGDVVTVSFAGKSMDVPYCENYSDIDNGETGLFGKSDDETLTLAVNMGNFAAAYGIADKVSHEDESFEWEYLEGMSSDMTFTIAIKEKRGYYDEYVVRQLSYTNLRADYNGLTDEQFANFRAVSTGGIGNVLYRSSSPADPSLGRSAYADAAAKDHGVSVIIDLNDDETVLAAYEGYGDTYSSTVRHIALNMGVDYTADDFKEKLKTCLVFIAENDGVYLIHCKEGKDRTGFVATLLEFLTGADYAEAEDDFMLTYYNYYGVVKGDGKYASIASNDFEKVLKRAFAVDDVKNADLVKLATDYIKSIGLSDAEIAALKANLSA